MEKVHKRRIMKDHELLPFTQLEEKGLQQNWDRLSLSLTDTHSLPLKFYVWWRMHFTKHEEEREEERWKRKTLRMIQGTYNIALSFSLSLNIQNSNISTPKSYNNISHTSPFRVQ